MRRILPAGSERRRPSSPVRRALPLHPRSAAGTAKTMDQARSRQPSASPVARRRARCGTGGRLLAVPRRHRLAATRRDQGWVRRGNRPARCRPACSACVDQPRTRAATARTAPAAERRLPGDVRGSAATPPIHCGLQCRDRSSHSPRLRGAAPSAGMCRRIESRRHRAAQLDRRPTVLAPATAQSATRSRHPRRTRPRAARQPPDPASAKVHPASEPRNPAEYGIA